MQGSIEHLAAEGAPTILVATSDDERALGILAHHRGVETTQAEPDGIRLTLHRDVEADAADDIGRCIVAAGLAIRRFEPTRPSLEQRFLEITSRLEEAA